MWERDDRCEFRGRSFLSPSLPQAIFPLHLLLHRSVFVALSIPLELSPHSFYFRALTLSLSVPSIPTRFPTLLQATIWLSLQRLGINSTIYDESWTGYAQRTESKIALGKE